MKSENLLTALLVLGFVLICAAFTSCSSVSGHRVPAKSNSLLAHITRVKVAEGRGTMISYVKLDSVELKVYRPLDTVWVNMATHQIDDTTEFAMACVLQATAQ